MLVSNRSIFSARPTHLWKGKEYKIKAVPGGNKYPEIVGRVGHIVKFTGDGQCYFLIEKDVYLLSVKEINPRPVSGLYNVDYAKVLSTNLMKDVSVHCGRELPEAVRSYARQLGIRLEEGEELDFPYIEITVNGVRLHLGIIGYLYMERRTLSGIVPYHSEGYAPEDFFPLAEHFEELTGKHLWTLMKTLSYLEIPMCVCGSRHQIWQEHFAMGKVLMKCAECSNILYKASEDFSYEPEESILELFKMNEKL